MGFRDKLRGILQVPDSPHHIAVSFAYGVFWGMSPLLGIHTIGAFFSAWLLKLNKFVVIIGVYVTNPWTIVPIYSFSLWLGAKLIGMKQILPEIEWEDVTFLYLVSKLKHLILPFVIGSFALGAVAAVVSYFIIYHLIIKYKREGNKVKDAA